MVKNPRTFLAVCFCLLLSCMLTSSLADDTVTTQAPLDQIKAYGNVVLTATGADLQSAGISLGDLVTVSFGDQSVVMPYCTNYTDVDTGSPVLVWRADRDDHAMAIAGGNFAQTYGLAEKNEDGWVSNEGDAVTVHIALHTSGAYFDEWMIRSIFYTDERADFPNLTDAEFANFREVKTTGIAPGTLYRSASPVDNKHNRAPYAAAEIQAAGVRVVLNLSDSSETLYEHELYANSYYAAQDVIALNMGMAPNDEDNMAKIAEGLRFALAHEGPICIHCTEGKDRTGYLCAVLELLCGASHEEMLADYMTSFSNYYGLTPDNGAWAPLITSFEKSLVSGCGEDLDAASYLMRCGLSQQEIDALILRLSK